MLRACMFMCVHGHALRHWPAALCMRRGITDVIHVHVLCLALRGGLGLCVVSCCQRGFRVMCCVLLSRGV
jgi:hypothetical protein